MPELSLIRIGRALLPADEDSEAKLLKIPERHPYKGKVTVPRLSKTHSTFFGVLADVCRHWPHGMEPNPEHDPELLRAWLLCRVDHCVKLDFPMLGDDRAQQRLMSSIDGMIQRLRLKGEYPFWKEGRIDGEPAIRLFLAKSINQDDLDEVDFRPIADHVYAEIYALTGMDVGDLIIEHKTRRPVAA